MIDGRETFACDGRDCVWSRIASELTDDIASGAYSPGERMPTEYRLAERFGVNRHTVRRALAALAASGLVRVVQGNGTYVGEFALELMLGRRTRHSLSLRLAGMPGGLCVLGAARVRASAEVARTLSLKRYGRVLRLQTLGEARQRPLHVSERFFPLPRFDGLERLVAESGSITQTFAALGVPDYVRRDSRISAVLPPPQIAALLAQPACRPALRVQSVNEDTNGIAVESATTYFCGDRIGLRVRTDG